MKTTIAMTSATAAVLLAVALSTGDLARVFLPMVRAQWVATFPLVVPAPEGVTTHLTQSGIFVDRAGRIFAKTRASSDRGDIVWRMDGDRATVVLEPGPSDARGNGYLTVISGTCVLVTTNDRNQVVAYRVPECEP